jgi:Uma2 family endonuclease
VSRTDPEHAYVTTSLGQRLREVYEGWALVREGQPLDAAVEEMPEPSVAVVRGALDDYARQHPTGADAVLVVEVARGGDHVDARDVEVYARCGVSECWLVDLSARQVEARTEPRPDGSYGLVRVLSGPQELSPPGCEVAWSVEELFPPS